jgi:hypothetical protein
VISDRQAPARRWLRIYTIVLGVLFLLWLPFEDQNEGLATAFAAAISIGLAARLEIGRPAALPRCLFLGAVAGLAVSPLAFLLMAFKTGLHGHAAPDFTGLQVVAVFLRAPVWALGGLLIGLGAALWRK